MIYFIAALFTIFSFFKSWEFITGFKIDFKKITTYLILFLAAIVVVISYEISNQFVKVINSVIVCIISIKLLFKFDLKKSMLLSIYTFLLVTFADMFFYILDQSTFKILSVDNYTSFIFLFSNIFIGALFMIICHMRKTKVWFNYLMEITSKIKEIQIVSLSLLILIIYSVFIISSYYIISTKYLVLSSAILIISTCIIIFGYLNSKNKYLKVYEKYNISLESIREYENILEKYKINNHENKNQLMIIRNMCNNKKTVSYIDALINNKVSDDDQLLMNIGAIPDGGLRGLIYSKLLVMKDKNIDFELNIDRKINSIKLRKIDDYLLTDICKIIGVFIDNAIEAVINLEKKYVIVELYEENGETNISITNNYIGHIDIDEINNPGYTTKDHGHGYGLTLVQELITKNKKLKNTKEIYEDNFMQTLKIEK